MQVTLESTTKVVELNGVPARVWEGTTASGIAVHAFITRIACDADEPRQEEFQRDLLERKPPSPDVQAYDFRLLLD